MVVVFVAVGGSKKGVVGGGRGVLELGDGGNFDGGRGDCRGG